MSLKRPHSVVNDEEDDMPVATQRGDEVIICDSEQLILPPPPSDGLHGRAADEIRIQLSVLSRGNLSDVALFAAMRMEEVREMIGDLYLKEMMKGVRDAPHEEAAE